MKTPLLAICLFISIFSYAQNFPVFKDITFDTTSKLIAISSSFSHAGEDSKAYCFLVDHLDELNNIKQDWIASDQHPNLFIEEYAISILVVKNNKLVNSRLLIYPKQQIIKVGNSWYNFNMKKFINIQTTHPLQYHSHTFSFDTYLDYAFFYDSLRYTNSYLFLYEPAPQFEGHFDIISTRAQENENPAFILKDINKELEAIVPKDKFSAQNTINDPFNLSNTEQFKTKVSCSKAVYDAYTTKLREKGKWVINTVDTKVFFKD